MDVQEYRRQLEQEIADQKAASEAPRWEEGLESAGAADEVGAATGGVDEAERLRTVVEDREAAPELRAAALGGLISRESEQQSDPQAVYAEAIRLLADATEAAKVRLAALQQLRVAAFHSPTASDWRPAFLEALRSASESEDDTLRSAALETLAAAKDRQTQQKLLRGLEDPAQALVPPEQALRLLGQDPHSGVREAAIRLAENPPSRPVRLEALRALASDPDSVDRFRTLLADGSETPAVRKLAATALASLDRDSLRAVTNELASAPGDATTESMVGPGEEQVQRHLSALLDLPE